MVSCSTITLVLVLVLLFPPIPLPHSHLHSHYPSRCSRPCSADTQVIGAPGFFHTIWSWVKGWLDPVVVSKTHILAPSEIFSTLSQYIDASNIPKSYGGQLDYTFGEKPVIGPDMAKHGKWLLADGVQPSLPIGPMVWRAAGGGAVTGTNGTSVGANGDTHEHEHGLDAGAMELVAVGIQEGKPRRETLVVLDVKYDKIFLDA